MFLILLLVQLNSAVQDHRLNKRIEYIKQQSSWINILTKTPFEVVHIKHDPWSL